MSATIYTAYRNNARFYVSWGVGQQDVANNRSLINWTAGIQAAPGQNSYWYTNAVRLNSLYIDGQGNLASGTWSNIMLYNGQTTPLRSGSVWIQHNPDGTKGFGMSFSGWLYEHGDLTTSGSWTVPTIPRNSQVSTNKSSYTLGEPIQIITNRKSSSFTHTIAIRKDNISGTEIKRINSVGDSFTWTPTAAEITMMQNLIPNSNVLNIHINQYNNQVGQSSSVTRSLTLTNANPEFTDFTYRDSSTGVVAITGSDQILVKGKSILETTISPENKMVAIKQANPSRYSISFDGTTRQEAYSSVDSVISNFSVNSIGQRTVIATAFDSRNNNTSVSKQMTVYDYSEPTIESTIQRENNFGEDTTVSLRGNWTPLTIDSQDKNALITGSLRYRFAEDGTAFLDNWETRSFTATGTTWEMDDPFVKTLDNTKKYIFEFEIADKFGTITSTGSVDVGTPIMFVGENNGSPAIGVGKMPQNGALDVDGDIYMGGSKVAAGPNLPGKLMAKSNIGQFSGISSSTFLPSSDIAVTMPEGRTTLIVYVSLSIVNQPSGSTQSVIELREGNNGTGTILTRRVTTTAISYSNANMSYVLVDLIPGNVYSFSLSGRVSQGSASIEKDPGSTDMIYAVLG